MTLFINPANIGRLIVSAFLKDQYGFSGELIFLTVLKSWRIQINFMTIKIAGCQDCPLFDDHFQICNHPVIDNWIDKPYRHNSNKIEMDSSGQDLSYVEFPITPDWCPLNKQPLTIIKQ
jgi:hypothetical protein